MTGNKELAGGVSDQTVPVVKTEVFEGPLDLLLTLIQKRKLFINDISLASVTDDYIAYIENIESFPIADSAQFVLIASTLVLIKSKSLLPGINLTEEEEGDIEELEERLKTYQRIKELSVGVEERYGSRVMASGSRRLLKHVFFSPTEEVTVGKLHLAMLSILERLPKRDMIPQTEIKKVVNLKDTIQKLTDRIQEGLRVQFSHFSGYKRGIAVTREERINIVVNFLAMLELVKKGTAQVTQRSHFEEILIENTTISTPFYDNY